MKRLLLKVASLFVVATMFYGCESLPSINNGGGGEDTSGDDLETLAAEREILIQFYRDTDGDNWTNNENWCSDKPIEEWEGVSVTDGEGAYVDGNWVDFREGRCVYIQLSNNNLRGSGSLAGMETLRVFWFDGNPLTSLDVSDCTALKELVCGANPLTSLDVSGCTELQSLACESMPLTSLDVSGCTELREMYVGYTPLTSLDVSGCTALEDLHCNESRLATLDVSGCTALRSLYCNNNLLTTLDVSGCTALEKLDCYDNLLSSLDISGCTELRDLSCDNNLLTQEITDIFEQLQNFIYDVRYEYWTEYPDGGGYVDHYKDNGVGWWYPGEPEKGYHGK